MNNSEFDSVDGPRKKPRYQLALKAEIWVRDLEHHSIEKTANISETGLFLCTELDLPPNDIVHVRIIFKDIEAYFDAKTRVVWRCDGMGSHPMGLGLQFVELSEPQKHIIQKYLTKYITTK